MKNFRGIYTAPVPSWAIQLPVGAQAAVDGGDIPVWGEVVGYAHEMERLYDGHIRASDDFWSKVSGRFIVLRHWDGSEKPYKYDEVSVWLEKKRPATFFSRISCVCGFHDWDDVPRRGLVRTVLDVAIFSIGGQIGEQHCRRAGCRTTHAVIREGWLAKDSKPKWRKASAESLKEFQQLSIF